MKNIRLRAIKITFVPYYDIKLAVNLLIRQKWQREWDWQSGNKLKDIKPYITIWSTINPRKTDIILTRLRTGHSRLTHRYLLLAEEQPTCPHYHSSLLTIRHILTDCFGLCYKYRFYFHSSPPSLTNLLGENPHPELFKRQTYIKRFRFYNFCLFYISCYFVTFMDLNNFFIAFN